MPDREKVIKGLNDIGGFIAGRVGFEQARNFLQTINDALALLKEQEDLGTELTNAVELIRKKNEQIEKLLKEQEAVTIKKTKEHGFGVYGGICPKCRNWIQSAHSFCGFCGQAVKWK